MTDIIADLQIHSRFSRAVSPQMTLPNIAMWARRKGIGLVATGDWTHPMWFREIERDLEETGNGLLRLKPQAQSLASTASGEGFAVNRDFATDNPLFLLATEVSCIYTQNGKGRRVHTLIWVPSIDSARKISQEMTKRGCNLLSDGRPIIGLTSIDVAELVLTIEPKALVIPAHAWTPWFSVFGSMSGFTSLDEAFGPYAKHIYAVETGLSSNPSMNWQIAELDSRAIISFSDAHSGSKLGREATVFKLTDDTDMISYQHIYDAISARSLRRDEKKLQATIAYTIEFYPEEGKYHWSGHRACSIRWGPEETRKNGSTCPVCGKQLTQGVEQRVSELSGRSEADVQLSVYEQAMSESSAVRMTKSNAFPNRPPFLMMVPLVEIIAEAIGSPVSSPKVQTPYFRLTDEVGSEFFILLEADTRAIAAVAGERVALGVDMVRKGKLTIDPGYDGVFGVVKIWNAEGKSIAQGDKEQLTLLS